jgi:hypothetical protein
MMLKLKPLTLAVILIITAGVLTNAAQDISATERSVLAFFDSYAEDLRQERREAIANRYDRRGAYLMGNGSKRLQTFEQIKDLYLTKWSGPKSFAWKDLSVEVISKNVVAVLGKFEWVTTSGQSMNFSYTGVLIKQKGEWRIRIEDESMAPPKPSN